MSRTIAFADCMAAAVDATVSYYYVEEVGTS